jgi:Tfp pilus assembly protein PilO
MRRNFKLDIKDPRVTMRVIIGMLLAANLVAAVIAFKPFGGSADDLRREEGALRQQLSTLQTRAATGKRLVDKVEAARKEGDQFLEKYVTDKQVLASTIQEELNRTAAEAGIKAGPASMQTETIEGSDTLEMRAITAGYQGTYPSLAKFMNLLDKSPRFLIIDNLTAAPLQNGQDLSVSIKLFAFVRTAELGAGL